jgi:hypothetical protein
MKHLINTSLIFLILLNSCNNEIDKIPATGNNETSYLKDSTVNVFVNPKIQKLITLYMDSLVIDSLIKQPIGYALLDKIDDTTVLFIGTDYNHRMIFDEENITLAIIENKNMPFPIYIKANRILCKKNMKTDFLCNNYSFYGDTIKYHNSYAIKFKCTKDTFFMFKKYSSVSHILELPTITIEYDSLR